MNLQIEETSHQVLNSLPHIIRDVETLGNETALLKSTMANLMVDVDLVHVGESGVGVTALDRLIQLDQVKERMSSAAQALHREMSGAPLHRRWKRLVSGWME